MIKNKSVKSLYLILFVIYSLLSSCSPPQKSPSEKRKDDILFLAKWAKDYSPFVELNEKYKNCPSYDSLIPYYMELAENAKNDEEFFQAVNGYFRLIGASGHASMLFENDLNYYIHEFRTENATNISIREFKEALVWARRIQQMNVFAHPPFRIKFDKSLYYTVNGWENNGKTIPEGSEIKKVNGMLFPDYLSHIKQNSWIKYLAYDKDWIDDYGLIIDEGKNFKGWEIEFLLPDKTTFEAFVPKVMGFPYGEDESDNCTCLEIKDNVGYIRIRSFPFGLIEQDGELIEDFLKKSGGKYKKLIIDIRNNGGGATEYFYNNLICPFLDTSVTYKQITGIKKKFLSDTKSSYRGYLRKHVSTPLQGVIDIKETKPPEEFNPDEWIFYEITRKTEPRYRYNFKGKIYILTENCFSAADDYVNIAKRIKLATLVGQKTNGGAAAYLAPVFVRLPNSGMIFMLEADLLLNPDGSFNELFGTKPDIELAPFDYAVSNDKAELIKDNWIRKIILEL